MDNKPSFRTKKIELSIKRLVSEFFVTQRDYLTKFPNARFEITNVKVSKDLRFARIFLVHNITEDEFKYFSKLYIKDIQNLIARTLTTKYTPKISLSFDQSFQESLKVQSLLDKL
ncbi:ribosome-binding factor A [Alphaproteobacteria bacterium]|nr:ribosome-binding factor A [Alphaproteobacteria bacterium]MDB2359324.1 ribosome-binding factor A [Alphaproteobacteria bacterium]MDB2564500.1 ribosome-binding factor A [Alphaproteobacteria bacterium]MDB2635731.1 ribosome-binding factor A [Alphaproteobacteria bacterium]MDB3863642.1 ribosome-binding factor A [Alphaproteobacteria bacterium]